MTKQDVAKMQIFKHFWTDFSDILLEDVKLMLNKVLNISSRILPPSLSYRENPPGGAETPPPLPVAGRGLRPFRYFDKTTIL